VGKLIRDLIKFFLHTKKHMEDIFQKLNFNFADRKSGYTFIHKCGEEEGTDFKTKSSKKGICCPECEKFVCQNCLLLG
jgi:hypothetical protein